MKSETIANNQQWRQFNFFESHQIKDAADDSLPGPAVFSKASKGSIISALNDVVYIGDQSGEIHALDKEFRVTCSIKAYEAGQVEQLIACEGQLLVSIGEEGTEGPVLKVWTIKTGKDNTSSFKHLSTLVLHSDKPFPITCCTAMKDLSHIAVGFSDGRVVLIKGDLARDRGAKQRTVYEGEEPVTGLEFLVEDKAVTLYIFSTSKMLTLTAANSTGKSVNQIPRIMESVGAALGCVAFDRNKNEIVVVRKDAIYLYGVDGRGPCYALDGRKTSLYIYNGYAIIDQPPNEPTSGTMKVLGKLGIPSTVEEASKIIILETFHKFIGHVGFFPQGLRTMFVAWDSLHILTMDGRIFRINEIPMESKMDILYDKHSYTLALALAKEAKYDEAKLNEIRISYADYLYKKGDFQASVKQYILAIKQCETSAVMRRFLEAQHVPLLTEFLEALHVAKLSNADYTTLLLNCYAKLKQKDKLQKFIRDGSDRPIDLEVAVALCRQAGYYDQAISLSTRHKNHNISLGIMIEDKKDHKAALTYIKKLKDPLEVEQILLHFGRQLMTALPADTTRLLIDVYTGKFVPESEIQASGIISPSRKASAVYGGAFYESMLNNKYSQVLPSLPTLDMSQFNPMRRIASANPSITTRESLVETASVAATSIPAVEESASSPLPPPRTAFSLFLDYPLEFIHFLEIVLERQPEHGTEDVKKTIVSTLLESYLKQANGSNNSAEQIKWQAKAKSLLNTHSEWIDTSNALLLFHLSSFQEGLILVQEKAGRKEDVFRSYCTAGDTQGVIKLLHQYAEDEPQLYPLALKYFSSTPETIAESGSSLPFVLTKIQEKKLMAPLQVIQTLSATSSATIGIIKSYLTEYIAKEQAEILKHQTLIDSYKKETEAKKAELKDLSEGARVLQVTRCARCSGTLDLPVIHFLCKHSFHQRCCLGSGGGSGASVGGKEFECPLCVEVNGAVRGIVASKQELAEKQEFFKEGLRGSKDKTQFLFSRLDLTSDLQ